MFRYLHIRRRIKERLRGLRLLGYAVACGLCIYSARGLTLTSENDLYAPNNKDRNFSNGAQITYSTSEYDYRFIHNIYTPTDISNPNLIAEDRPYCGLLAFSRDNISFDGLNKQIKGWTVGMIGPYALGEEVQSSVHSWSGARDPKGWDSQLDSEPIINYRYEQERNIGGEYFQIGRGYRVDLGNFLTALSLSVPLKAGYGVHKYRDQRVVIEGLDFDNGWSFGVESKASVKVIGRDITLDGNTFSSSHSVEKEYAYGEFSYGVFIKKDGVSCGISQVLRTDQFKGQKDGQAFGVIAISF